MFKSTFNKQRESKLKFSREIMGEFHKKTHFKATSAVAIKQGKYFKHLNVNTYKLFNEQV